MPEIKQRISLDGADDVANKLKKIGDTGSDAFKKLREFSDKGGEGFSKFGNQAQELDGREVGQKLREALHALHPVLDQAGLGLGNLGAFARLAGAGLVPLGAAIAGSLLVGLAKVGDEADRTKARLKGFGGGAGSFEDLSKQAKSLGTDVANLQPAFEKFLAYRRDLQANDRSIIRPPGFQPGENEEAASRAQILSGGRLVGGTAPPTDSFLKAEGALFAGTRLDKTAGDDASKAIEQFFDSVFAKGLTGDALKSLQTTSPSAANLVAKSQSQAFGQNFADSAELAAFLNQRGISVPSNQVIAGLAKQEPQARGDAEAAHGVTAAFEGLEASARRLAEELGGDRGITQAVDTLAHLIDMVAENADRQLHPRDYEPGGPKFIGPVSDAERQDYNKPDIFDLGKTLITGESDKRFEDSNATKFMKFLRDGPAVLQQTPSEALDYLSGAAKRPGAIYQQQQPFIDQTNSNQPPPRAFDYIPPPSVEEQRRLDRDRLQQPYLAPSSEPAQQPSNTPIQFGQADQPQQLASLGGAFQDFIATVSAALNRAKDTTVTQPMETIGVRGAVGGYVSLDSGGHVQGPGTSTSDDVPAMLSDGEFVIKASSVQKLGAPFLHWLNAGKYADGGSVTDSGKAKAVQDYVDSGHLGSGNHEITYDPATGGAYIDGALHLPGDPLLDDPIVKRAIDESLAAMNTPAKKRKYKSDFVGRFGHDDDADSYVADGGLISRLASGGVVGGSDFGSIFDPGRFAMGGSDFSSEDVSSLGSPAAEHLGTVDLRTDHGDLRVSATRSTVDEIHRAAVTKRMVRTGNAPAWVGGS